MNHSLSPLSPRSSLWRWTVALAAAAPAFPAQAGVLTLTGWEYGGGELVRVSSPAPDVNLRAGALRGVLSGLAGEQARFNGALVTYCVELTQWAPAWQRPTSGYAVVDALTHFGADHRGNQLGSFMTYVGTQSLFDADDPRVLNTGAVQLAIWNILYDDDHSLRGGSLLESINVASRQSATNLLAGWNRWHAQGGRSIYDVGVLRHASHQDFLLLSERPTQSAHAVPLPGTLALLAPALLALAALRRRG